jgi:hypothetical protein
VHAADTMERPAVSNLGKPKDDVHEGQTALKMDGSEWLAVRIGEQAHCYLLEWP